MDSERLSGHFGHNSDSLAILFVQSLLSIPANIVLITFCAKRVHLYKVHNVKSRFVSNCFFTYLLEITAFDTAILLDLFTNTMLHVIVDNRTSLSMLNGEVFAYKAFVYVLHVSTAMCSWLTFLFAFNRSMLLKHVRIDRLCINTKYQTLFLFCACTIANVLRLEAWNIGNGITFSDGNATLIGHSATDLSRCWLMIGYYLVFMVMPLIGTMVASIWLIRKRLVVKNQLLVEADRILSESRPKTQDKHACNMDESSRDSFEFLGTCIPCIVIAFSFIVCYLPYTCVTIAKQSANMAQSIPVRTEIFVNVLRYLFHGCKFYLLFLTSFKFRKEVVEFFGRTEKRTTTCAADEKTVGADDLRIYT